MKHYALIAYLIVTVVSYILSVLIHAFQEIKKLTANNIGLTSQYKKDQKEIKQLKIYSNGNQQTIDLIFTLLGQIKQKIEDLKD